MSDDVSEQRRRRWEIAGFILIALLIAWDLLVDYGEDVGLGHLAVELLVFIVAIAGALSLWRRLGRTSRDLSLAREEAERWRQENREMLQGFAAAISRQFERWSLTPAEAEIGFLLLRGLSHKEIALLRDTSERTVREQSRSVYRKSGLSGRAAFSAFFLENITAHGE